jgi:hypothetical protein
MVKVTYSNTSSSWLHVAAKTKAVWCEVKNKMAPVRVEDAQKKYHRAFTAKEACALLQYANDSEKALLSLLCVGVRVMMYSLGKIYDMFDLSSVFSSSFFL